MKKRVVSIVGIIMVAMMMLQGCANKQKEESNLSNIIADSNKIEAEQDKKENIKEPEEKGNIKGLDEVNIYKKEKIQEYVAALENSGISYEKTENELAVFSERQEYILESRYDLYSMAMSVTDYPNSMIHTLSGIVYEFHSEKGIGEKELNLIYNFIQNTEDKLLKEKISSIEILKTKIENQENFYGDTSYCTFDSYGAQIEMQYAVMESIPFEKEEIELTYLEFDTLDEYKAFREDVFNLRSGTADTGFVAENDFAIGMRMGTSIVSGECQSSEEAILAFCHMINLQEEETQNVIEDTRMWHQLTNFYKDMDTYLFESFDFEFGTNYYAQYSYESIEGNYGFLKVVIPIKVQGLKNS